MNLTIYKSRKDAINFNKTNIAFELTDSDNCKYNKSTPKLLSKYCSLNYAHYICDEYYNTDRMLLYLTKTNKIRCCFWTGGGDIIGTNYKPNKNYIS